MTTGGLASRNNTNAGMTRRNARRLRQKAVELDWSPEVEKVVSSKFVSPPFQVDLKWHLDRQKHDPGYKLPKKLIELVDEEKSLGGKTFGSWTVVGDKPAKLHQSPNGKGFFDRWLAKCVCGTVKVVAGSGLRQGTTKSCGCQRVKNRLKTMEARKNKRRKL